MRHTAAEKYEVIRLVEGSDLPARQTLRELQINRSTFYTWSHRYATEGRAGLAPKPSAARRYWNRIPPPGVLPEICGWHGGGRAPRDDRGHELLRAYGWSPDGNSLVFDLVREGTGRDIGVLSVEGERSWVPLLDSEATERVATISPDGQWIAYVSDETGRGEVYVQRFPNLGERQQVSTDGGVDPTWSPDGRALFYLGTRGRGGPDEMAVVTLDPGPPLSVGNPEVLFDYAPYIRPLGRGRQYDIFPDGQRFVMWTRQGTALETGATTPQINVVVNWHQELLERVPIP